MTRYDQAFYDQITAGSVRSARKVVPVLLEVFPDTKSVVDFGCGTGAWLSVWQENGVENIHGIDGDYVDRNQLLIPQDRFMAYDFSVGNILDVGWDGRFDLAMSLEVAEHVPESMADYFVKNLVLASDVILFSAAIPGQGGVNHMNEQWPSYWVPKFQAHGYKCSSNFRFDFWHDEEIENWYRQNILLFVKNVELVPDYDRKYFLNHPEILDVVHPNNWIGKI